MLINTYREPTDLFVDGDVLSSREGTTQGDPLAMSMYAIATAPLIQKLNADVTQIWYADDASGVGRLPCLRSWWDQINSLGPGFGYFANAVKTWLITKEEHLADAKETFAGTCKSQQMVNHILAPQSVPQTSESNLLIRKSRSGAMKLGSCLQLHTQNHMPPMQHLPTA